MRARAQSDWCRARRDGAVCSRRAASRPREELPSWMMRSVVVACGSMTRTMVPAAPQRSRSASETARAGTTVSTERISWPFDEARRAKREHEARAVVRDGQRRDLARARAPARPRSRRCSRRRRERSGAITPDERRRPAPARAAPRRSSTGPGRDGGRSRRMDGVFQLRRSRGRGGLVVCTKKRVH